MSSTEMARSKSPRTPRYISKITTKIQIRDAVVLRSREEDGRRSMSKSLPPSIGPVSIWRKLFRPVARYCVFGTTQDSKEVQTLRQARPPGNHQRHHKVNRSISFHRSSNSDPARKRGCRRGAQGCRSISNPALQQTIKKDHPKLLSWRRRLTRVADLLYENTYKQESNSSSVPSCRKKQAKHVTFDDEPTIIPSRPYDSDEGDRPRRSCDRDLDDSHDGISYEEAIFLEELWERECAARDVIEKYDLEMGIANYIFESFRERGLLQDLLQNRGTKYSPY